MKDYSLDKCYKLCNENVPLYINECKNNCNTDYDAVVSNNDPIVSEDKVVETYTGSENTESENTESENTKTINSCFFFLGFILTMFFLFMILNFFIYGIFSKKIGR